MWVSAQIVEIVWTQSQVDIFFVDWERDKGEAVHTREDDVLDDVEAKGGRKHRRVKYVPRPLRCAQLWHRI